MWVTRTTATHLQRMLNGVAACLTARVGLGSTEDSTEITQLFVVKQLNNNELGDDNERSIC